MYIYLSNRYVILAVFGKALGAWSVGRETGDDRQFPSVQLFVYR